MIRLLFTVALALVLAGCSSSRQESVPPALAKGVSDSRINISPSLQKIVQLTEVNAARGRSGFYELHVTVKNISSERRPISYIILWLDQDGEPMPTPAVHSAPWMLFRGEVSPLIITSQSPLVRDFSMRIVDAE